MRGLAQRIRNLETGDGDSGIAIALADDESFEEAWAATFGDEPMPDDPNFLLIGCKLFCSKAEVTPKLRFGGSGGWGPKGKYYTRIRAQRRAHLHPDLELEPWAK